MRRKICCDESAWLLWPDSKLPPLNELPSNGKANNKITNKITHFVKFTLKLINDIVSMICTGFTWTDRKKFFSKTIFFYIKLAYTATKPFTHNLNLFYLFCSSCNTILLLQKKCQSMFNKWFGISTIFGHWSNSLLRSWRRKLSAKNVVYLLQKQNGVHFKKWITVQKMFVWCLAWADGNNGFK